jgi:hypothetical protein
MLERCENKKNKFEKNKLFFKTFLKRQKKPFSLESFLTHYPAPLKVVFSFYWTTYKTKKPLCYEDTRILSMADGESSKEATARTLRNAFGNVLSFFILLLIGVLAFSIRLFSVSSLSP